MKKKFLFFGGVMTLLLAAGGILLSESNTPKYELTPAQIANLDALTSSSEIETGDVCYNDTKFDINKPKAVVCDNPCKLQNANINLWQSTSYCP